MHFCLFDCSYFTNSPFGSEHACIIRFFFLLCSTQFSMDCVHVSRIKRSFVVCHNTKTHRNIKYILHAFIYRYACANDEVKTILNLPGQSEIIAKLFNDPEWAEYLYSKINYSICWIIVNSIIRICSFQQWQWQLFLLFRRIKYGI